MPQLAPPGIEDTKPVDVGPHVRATWYQHAGASWYQHARASWYQRSPAAAVGAGLGIFLLAAIVFAVITVSNNSTRAPEIVRSPATSLTPVPSIATSSTPTATAAPTPSESPLPEGGGAPGDGAPGGGAPGGGAGAGGAGGAGAGGGAPAASPGDSAQQTPPTVPGDSAQPTPPTVTQTVSTENVAPEAPAPAWPGIGPRLRRLFPHLFGG